MKKTAGWLSSLATFALVAATLPAGTVSAHVKSFDSKVTLRVTSSYVYKGRVKSDERDCYRHREVRIYNKNGDLLHTGETNNRGKYRLQAIGEKYYSKVDEVTVGSGNHEHTCRADKSETTEPPARVRRDERVATEITINDRCSFDCRATSARRNYTFDFYGKVKSRAPRCERRREVKLYRRAASGPGFELIGETESDGDGNWEMTRTDKPGFTKYLVKTTAENKGNKLCERATSDKESHDSF